MTMHYTIKLVVRLGILNISEFNDIIVILKIHDILVEKLEIRVCCTLTKCNVMRASSLLIHFLKLLAPLKIAHQIIVVYMHNDVFYVATSEARQKTRSSALEIGDS